MIKKILVKIFLLVAISFATIFYIKGLDLSQFTNLIFLKSNAYFYLILFFIFHTILIVHSNTTALIDFNQKANPLILGMIFFISSFSSMVAMFKINLPVRFILLKKYLNIPYHVSVNVKIWIMVLNIYIHTIVAMVSINFIHDFPKNIKIGILLFGTSIIISSLVFYFIIKKSKFNFSRIKYFKSFLTKLDYYVSSFTELSIRSIFILLIQATFRLLIITFSTYFIFNELIVYNNDMSFTSFLSIQAISSIISLISFLPHGIGTKDISFLYLFSIIGIDKEIAIILLIYDRLLWTFLPFVFGAISILFIKKDE